MSLLRYACQGAVVALAFLSTGSAGFTQEACVSQPVSVTNDGLRLAGVLMRPPGIGPFPIVLYAHSSKAGQEATPTLEAGIPCFPFVSERRWVYVAFDRRGYGRSEGVPLRDALGSRSGLSLLLATRARYEQEASDVLVALKFARRLPFASPRRVAAVGYSLGGQIVFLAASKEPDAFRAIVIQGTGSGRYQSLLLREMLAVAEPIAAPILIQHARDDVDVPLRFSTDLATGLTRMGKDATLRIYPGEHTLFASDPRGPAGEWGRDLVEFLALHFAR